MTDHHADGDHRRIPARLRARVAEIDARTDAFAAAHLDAEYAALCRRMTGRLARLRPSPLERGSARAWAAAVTHAVGWVNFLADPSQTPHLSTAELARLAGVGQSTLAAYHRVIRDALDLHRLDPEWTRPSGMLDNPMAWLVLVNGVPVDIRHAPRAMQEAALAQGAIPFLPPPDPEAEADARAFGEGESILDALLAGGAEGPSGATPNRVGANGVGPNGAGPPEDAERELAAFTAAFAGAAGAYNRSPQAELGGLSPEAVHALLSADWEAPGGALWVREDVPAALALAAPAVRDARLVLALLGERAPVRATPKGNLPRPLVAAFRAGRAAWADPEDEGVGSRQNEEDVAPLHRARVLLELAGLVKRRRGVVSRTRRGDALATEERAGALLALLVRTHFRAFNLAYLDGLPAAPGFQATAAYTLYQFGRGGEAWRTPAELAESAVLPPVRDEVRAAERPFGGYDPLALMLETRLLRGLVGFGLADVRRGEREPGEWRVPVWYRPGGAFGRVFGFAADGGDR